MPSDITYQLRRPRSAAGPVTPSAEQRAVIGHVGYRLRVLAGPGTGKTATIVEAVAERIERRGVDPQSMVILTFSRRAADDLAKRLAARLSATVTQPLVRTLHSYAYSLVRSAAVAAGDPPPRLLDAGQADLMVREMLAGHVDDGGRHWPPHLLPALTVPTFAAELREFLMRTSSMQLRPQDIAVLGRRRGRPEWIAAAEFIEEYRDIADLRQASSRFGAALDQAELTTAALERLADPTVLAEQQARLRRIIVDEYQDVDPAQAEMIEIVASGADELIVVGDPDQAIYTFRGSQPGALERVEADRTVALTTSYRMAPVVLSASRRVAALIPGRTEHRDLRSARDDDAAEVLLRILPSAAQEGAFVADQLRRAHLEGGIAWSDMAVLVRSPQNSADSIRRACIAAGVPVVAGSTRPLAEDSLIDALLTVLESAVEPEIVTGPTVAALLASPLGGMDPLSLRRVRRAVRGVDVANNTTETLGASDPDVSARRSSFDILADLVTGRQTMPPGLSADLAGPLRRVAAVVAAAARYAAGDSPEEALWEVWQTSGAVQRLLDAVERGGGEADVANAQLDAAVALFDRAAEFVDQLPGAGIRPFVDVVRGEQIAGTDSREGHQEAVAIMSAHAAKGLEWSVVAVAGVQEDHWPDTRPRSSLLQLPALLDAAEGIQSGPPQGNLLADERRLFYVAVTRARRRLIVTAVDNDEVAPSRFVEELAGPNDVPRGWPRDDRGRPLRTLQFPALVADLRREIVGECRDGAPGESSRAAEATRALAMLAAAHVRGAHPDSWYGVAGLTTDDDLVAPGAPVVLSPSQVESLLACPLRAVLERTGGRGDSSQAQLVGVVIHALAEGMAMGASDADMDAAVDVFVEGQEQLAQWERDRVRRKISLMRGALERWVREIGSEREFVGSETELAVRLPPGDGSGEPGGGQDSSQAASESAVGLALPSGHPIDIRGRIDWLSWDDEGRLVITDFKTGASVPSVAKAEDNAQLAVYQLAVTLGTLDASSLADGSRSRIRGGSGTGVDPGGGELVYVSDGSPRVRLQKPLTATQRSDWLIRLQQAASAASGAHLVASVGDQCSTCPVRGSCPLQPEGRQVTG